MPFDFNDDTYDQQLQPTQDAFESPLLAPSTPSGPASASAPGLTALGLGDGASKMFDKLKGASSGLREKIADSQLKDSVVALGDRVGSELSQVSATISEKSASTREAVGKSTRDLRDSVSTAGASVRDSISIDVPGQPQREKSRLEQVSDNYLPALSWKQRVIGCLACMAIGYTLSLGGFFRLTEAMMGNPGPFVINSTIGNIISLCGSCFLTGPTNQAKKMFHASRRIATSLYLGSLALTLLVAFAAEGMTGQGIVLIVLMLIQYVAIAWYCLSYIPFARQAAKRLLNRYYNQVSGDDM